MAEFITERQKILTVLSTIKTIALVGASINTKRPSYQVMKVLLSKGFTVIPVNHAQAGTMLLGQTIYATLKDIPVPIDMVDVFRNPDAMPKISEDIINLSIKPKLLWMQLGVIHEKAAQSVITAGIDVVVNRCPVIELGIH